LNDRQSQLWDVKAWLAFLTAFAWKRPVTAALLLLQTGSYIMLRLWQEGKSPIPIDWGYVYHQSILGQDSMDEHRYYTLVTCFLFNLSLPSLIFGCVAIGLFYGLFEKWMGRLATLALAVVASVVPGLVFLYFTGWMTRYATLAPWQCRVIDIVRQDHQHYTLLWQPLPMWWLACVTVFTCAPKLRIAGIPMWLVVFAATIGEFWLVHKLDGDQQHTWDTVIVTTVLGIVTGMGLRMRKSAWQRWDWK